MALLLEPHLDQQVDMTKLLKMIIIHDLVEAEAGDTALTDMIKNPSLKAIKQQRETKAIEARIQHNEASLATWEEILKKLKQ